jgi:hypothetical protein
MSWHASISDLFAHAIRPSAVLAAAVFAVAGASAQELIAHFHEIERTPDRLTIGVDYSYSGHAGNDHVYIYAIAVSGNDERVLPLRNTRPQKLLPGVNSVTLTMEREPKSIGDVTQSVRVCMMARVTGDVFFCDQFALAKPWGIAAPAPSEPAEQTTARAPAISVFAARDSRILSGDPVVLSWQTADAQVVLLGRASPNNTQAIDGAESVPPVGGARRFPDHTTTYVLQAEQGSQKVRKELVVTVVPPLDLTVSPTGDVCREHGAWTFSWNPIGASEVILNGKRVDPQDHLPPMHRSFTYNIVARNGFGDEVSLQGTIKVIKCDLQED